MRNLGLALDNKNEEIKMNPKVLPSINSLFSTLLAVIVMCCIAFLGFDEPPINSTKDFLVSNTFGRLSFLQMVGGTIFLCISFYMMGILLINRNK